MSITVVLAEDNALLGHGLSRLIDSAADLSLVGAAADLPHCLALVEEHAPDVVVTDIRMPPTQTDEGLAIAARLRTERPDAGVVLLSQYAEATHALTLLAEGSARRGYLLKERVADGDELADAIRRVRGALDHDQREHPGPVDGGREAHLGWIGDLREQARQPRAEPSGARHTHPGQQTPLGRGERDRRRGAVERSGDDRRALQVALAEPALGARPDPDPGQPPVAAHRLGQRAQDLGDRLAPPSTGPISATSSPCSTTRSTPRSAHIGAVCASNVRRNPLATRSAPTPHPQPRRSRMHSPKTRYSLTSGAPLLCARQALP